MRPGRQVLLLDDDPAFRAAVREGLEGWYGLVEAGTVQEFRAVWSTRRFALLLLDMRLRRDREGLDVLREVFAQDEDQPVIMVSAYGDTETAIEAVGAGAMMFLHKQEFSPPLLARMTEAVIEQGRLRRQVRVLRRQAWADEPDTLLGGSSVIREAAETLRSLARERSQWPVLSAERGAGASLAARLLHRAGREAEEPFLEVAAGAIEEAGDGFFEARWSPWQLVEGGTLAVDGAQALKPACAERILDRCKDGSRRVVLLHREQVEMFPNRHSRSPGIDVPAWLAGLNPRILRIPPLRDRREDIPLLAAHFLQQQRSAGQTTARGLSGGVIARLESHSWPGNVRELRHAVEHAALQATLSARVEVGLEHLPFSFASTRPASPATHSSATASGNYRLTLARAELAMVDEAIVERGLRQKTALAKALGYTDRFTFARRLEKALNDFPMLAFDFPAVAQLFAKAAP